MNLNKLKAICEAAKPICHVIVEGDKCFGTVSKQFAEDCDVAPVYSVEFSKTFNPSIITKLLVMLEMAAQWNEAVEYSADYAGADKFGEIKMVEQTHAVRLWQSLATVSLHETIEAFYIAARADGLEEALRCYSPDDTATDWADKIKAIKEKS